MAFFIFSKKFFFLCCNAAHCHLIRCAYLGAGRLGTTIWARLLGHDHFGAHPLGAGTFGCWQRLGTAVSALCCVIAVNVQWTSFLSSAMHSIGQSIRFYFPFLFPFCFPFPLPSHPIFLPISLSFLLPLSLPLPFSLSFPSPFFFPFSFFLSVSTSVRPTFEALYLGILF